MGDVPGSPPYQSFVAAAPPPAATAPSYFVEFRARENDVGYGHSYLVYWSEDVRGRLLERHVISFYPAGGYAGMAAGVFIVPALVGSNEDDERRRDLNVYRRGLTAPEYERLAQYVTQKQATPQVFSLFTYNCNSFAAEAAVAIGLKAPPNHVIMPEYFISALRDINA